MSSNQFDRQILDLVNNERTNAGLDTLSIDSQLDRAANVHTDEMVQADRMSHQLPGEVGLGDRVSETGYEWTRVGENVAAGQTTPEGVMYGEYGWMNSDKHRAAILNSDFTHMGVGYENAPDDIPNSNDTDVYWTQVFGAGDNNSETTSDTTEVNQTETNAKVANTGNDIKVEESNTDAAEVSSESNNSDNNVEVEMEQPDTSVDNNIFNTEMSTGAENSNAQANINNQGNNFDQQILDLVNNERANAGLDSLSIDSQLDRAANAHTNEMVQADKMEYQLPGEAGLGDRVSETGYDWRSVGENIAAGQENPEEVMSGEYGWMNSPKHRAAILNPNFTHLGVGYENAPDDISNADDPDIYWTQVFGAESAGI